MGRPRELFINKGDRFERLQVVRQTKATNGYTAFVCLCDCGNETIATAHQLKSKKKMSCGCYHREMVVANATKHGMSRSRIYKVWIGIKGRCLNPNKKAYKWYGGRGIVICDEWLRFENFYQWAMSNGYKNNLTIERILNDGPYSPENCKFILNSEQSKNRRDLYWITYNGETRTLSGWAMKLGMYRKTLSIRLARWSKERAFTEPVNTKFGPKRCNLK